MIKSHPFSHQGVQQGDSLSPTLFIFFINDLPSVLRNASDGVTLGYVNLNCLLFADNIFHNYKFS